MSSDSFLAVSLEIEGTDGGSIGVEVGTQFVAAIFDEVREKLGDGDALKFITGLIGVQVGLLQHTLGEEVARIALGAASEAFEQRTRPTSAQTSH